MPAEPTAAKPLDSSGARDAPQRLLWGVAPAGLVLLVSVWEIVATVRADASVATAQEWRAAAAAVRALHRRGDLVVFAPRWIEPVGRLHLGDLLPLEVVGRTDGARFGTIWELSLRGDRARETRGCVSRWEADFGRVRVRRFACTAVHVLTDFVDRFPEARLDSGRPVVELESIGFEARRCIRVVIGPRDTVRVVYPAARLGGAVVLFAGLVDEFPRFRTAAERGHLTLLVDGVRRASVIVRGPWTRWLVPTQAATRAEVAFEIRALGPLEPPRQICFAAEARR